MSRSASARGRICRANATFIGVGLARAALDVSAESDEMQRTDLFRSGHREGIALSDPPAVSTPLDPDEARGVLAHPQPVPAVAWMVRAWHSSEDAPGPGRGWVDRVCAGNGSAVGASPARTMVERLSHCETADESTPSERFQYVAGTLRGISQSTWFDEEANGDASEVGYGFGPDHPPESGRGRY